jgi:hypothetical protein
MHEPDSGTIIPGSFGHSTCVGFAGGLGAGAGFFGAVARGVRAERSVPGFTGGFTGRSLVVRTSPRVCTHRRDAPPAPEPRR